MSVADTTGAVSGLMATGISGEIFKVGSTERVSIIELAERILAATGSDSTLIFTPYDSVYGQGIEDMLHRQPSIEKITTAIDWQPTRCSTRSSPT